MRANEEIIESNKEFVNRFYGQVDSSSNAKIDTDKLEELSGRALEINQIFFEAMNTVLPSTNNISELSSELININKMKEIIQKLNEFENGNLSLYQTAKVLLESVSKGIAYLDSGTWDATTNSFKSSKASNMSWADKLNRDWKIEKETSKTELYMKQFGMSEEQAKALIEFEEKFIAYAKTQGWSQEKINQEFVKIIASKIYGNTGNISQNLWEISAGVYSKDELIGILKKMGYTDKEIISFNENIQELYRKEGLTNDYIHLAGSLAVILNDSGMSLITKGASASVSSSDVIKSYYWEAATYGGDIASGSISIEDIRSDIDAIVIGSYLKANPSRNITDTMNEYYLNVESGKLNRAEELLKYYGNGDINLGYEKLKEAVVSSVSAPSNQALTILYRNFDISDDVQTFMDGFNQELNTGN